MIHEFAENVIYSCYYDMKLLENPGIFDVVEQRKCTIYFYNAILFYNSNLNLNHDTYIKL